LKIINFI